MGTSPSSSLLIAGPNSADDWTVLKQKLLAVPPLESWGTAHEQFYMMRIKTRYLDPMDAIEKSPVLKGEGFAIVALLCSLIEFLEACECGLNYQRAAPTKYEYSDSKALFQHFWRRRVSFNRGMPDDLVLSFYEDVRCALFHEARTKGGWRILMSADQTNGVIAERLPSGTIALYRNTLRHAFKQYFADYKERLARKRGKQDAFIRKFDALCQP